MNQRININGILYERVLKNKISKWKTESFDLSKDIKDTFNEFKDTLLRDKYVNDVDGVFYNSYYKTLELNYYLGRKATTEVSIYVTNIDDSKKTYVQFTIDTRRAYKEIKDEFYIQKVLKRYFDMQSSIGAYDNGMNLLFEGRGVPTLKSLLDFHKAFLKVW